jgi:hypothetical protein
MSAMPPMCLGRARSGRLASLNSQLRAVGLIASAAARIILVVDSDAQRAALDRRFEGVRARIRLLDQFRRQARADLDALNELTKLVTPPASTDGLDLTRDSVRLNGESPQAATPANRGRGFRITARSSGCSQAAPIRGVASETFQIHSSRENRK